MDDDRELGFVGMLAAGFRPQEAWQEIREQVAADPGVRAIIAELEADETGRAALAWSRQQWARHGLPAPWAAVMSVAGFRAGGEPFRTELPAQAVRVGDTLTVDGVRHLVVAVDQFGVVHVGRGRDD